MPSHKTLDNCHVESSADPSAPCSLPSRPCHYLRQNTGSRTDSVGVSFRSPDLSAPDNPEYRFLPCLLEVHPSTATRLHRKHQSYPACHQKSIHRVPRILPTHTRESVLQESYSCQRHNLADSWFLPKYSDPPASHSNTARSGCTRVRTAHAEHIAFPAPRSAS